MLELRHVGVRHGKRQAVSDVNLHVHTGEIVTLVGGNGAGKTTTLKAISGLLPICDGELWWDGERIDGLALTTSWPKAWPMCLKDVCCSKTCRFERT